MDIRTRNRLEEAGWRFADPADFLEMSVEERRALQERLVEILATRPHQKDANPPEGRDDE